MAAQVKGTAPKRPQSPAAHTEPPVPDGDIVRLDDTEPEGEPERVPVFAIGDKVYTMLAHPPVTLAIEALDVQYQRGQGYAEVFVMREMLGPEAYRALLNAKRITRQQLEKISEKISKTVYGALEEEDPNR